MARIASARRSASSMPGDRFEPEQHQRADAVADLELGAAPVGEVRPASARRWNRSTRDHVHRPAGKGEPGDRGIDPGERGGGDVLVGRAVEYGVCTLVLVGELQFAECGDCRGSCHGSRRQAGSLLLAGRAACVGRAGLNEARHKYLSIVPP